MFQAPGSICVCKRWKILIFSHFIFENHCCQNNWKHWDLTW